MQHIARVFAGFQKVRLTMSGKPQAPTPIQSIVAGAAAGGVESLVTVSIRHIIAHVDPEQ